MHHIKQILTNGGIEMKKGKVVVRIVIAIVVVLLVGLIASCFIRPDMGDCTEYKFDVKHFLRVATTIEIEKSGESYAKVQGNIWKFVEDPLTMYDTNGNKLAYAGDEYHLIAQDSHSIFVNNSLAAEMVGRVNLFGETYDIYNASQEKIARVTINMINTKGKMYDADGNLVADYRSFPLCKDFDVRIAEDCELDENVVLMIFSSYYSDYKADSQSSSNHRSSKH